MTDPTTNGTDLFTLWANDLRDHTIQPIATATAERVAAAAAVGAASTLIATAAAQAAQGGMMTASAATTAAASGSTAAKIMAGSLAAALTAGGAAAVTGNLPAGAQNFTADLAAHVGLDLPHAGATVDLDVLADLSLGDVIDIAGAGQVAVGLDADGNLVLASVDAASGFTAEVVAETSESIMVTFESAAETTTVLISEVQGEIMSSITTTLKAAADAGAEGESNGSAEAEGNASFNGSADSDAGSAEAEGNATVGIKIGR